ncbi:MAG: DUF4139 domain-containing protein [bacterium]
MKKRHFKICLIAFTVILILTVAVTKNVSAEKINITIYNHGQALVTETRKMDIEKGQSKVLFDDVPQSINPKTLQIKSLTSPDNFSVLDMNYEYDLINTKTLLDKYVGEEIKIVVPHPTDAKQKMFRQAKLIANNDRPIFEFDDNIYIGDYESVMLAEIPDNLRATPALVWLVDNHGEKEQSLEVSYLADKIKWDADYVLTLHEDEKSGALNGWVTLENRSGKMFEDAALKLVAGDLNIVRPDRRMRNDMVMEKSMAMGSKPMKQEEIMEYHLYSLDRKVDIKNNQIKQVSLLQNPKVRLNKKLISISPRYQGKSMEQDVQVFLQTVNDEKHGLNTPLPKGVVRVYQKSSDGSSVFVGEDRIEHTPINADIDLLLGTAFDVEVDKVLKNSQELSSKVHRFDWEIEISNGKKEDVTVYLRENFPNNSKIMDNNFKYSKIDNNNVEFEIKVEAQASKTLKFTLIVDNNPQPLSITR